MKLGIGEILMIIIVILFVVGPDKIPEFAKKFGEGLKAFRKATSGVTQEIRENVIEPLNEAAAPLKEAMEPINEMRNDLTSFANDIQKDMQGLTDDLNKEVKGLSDDLNRTGETLENAAAGGPETVPAQEESPEEEETAAEEPAAAAVPAEWRSRVLAACR